MKKQFTLSSGSGGGGETGIRISWGEKAERALPGWVVSGSPELSVSAPHPQLSERRMGGGNPSSGVGASKSKTPFLRPTWAAASSPPSLGGGGASIWTFFFKFPIPPWDKVLAGGSHGPDTPQIILPTQERAQPHAQPFPPSAFRL